jgi:hypothetical protein
MSSADQACTFIPVFGQRKRKAPIAR